MDRAIVEKLEPRLKEDILCEAESYGGATMGIDRARVEIMEACLKEDNLREADRYGGSIMVIHETEDGEIFDSWESVDYKSIQTPLEVYKCLEAEGLPIKYARVPITDGKAPKSSDFDIVASNISPASRGSTFVFNCQMGRGRTTTGTVIACLLKLRLDHGRPIKMIKEDNYQESLGFGSSSGEEAGAFAASLSDMEKPDIGTQKDRMRKRVLWHNLREEPVVYINGRPFILRDVDKPFSNLEYAGINRDRVEQMESRLKKDILLESARYGNKILVTDELPDGQMVDQWEDVRHESVKTPLEALRISKEDINTEIIYNCKMGRGRTSTGMVIATLVYLNRIGSSGIPRTKSIGQISSGAANVTDDMPNSEEAMRRGEYAVIRSLIRVLEGGIEGKRQVDKVIDECDTMQMGRGRITTGTVIACLLKLRLDHGRPIKMIKEDNYQESLGFGSSSGEEAGAFAASLSDMEKPDNLKNHPPVFGINDILLLRKITRPFDNKVECREALDAVIDNNDEGGEDIGDGGGEDGEDDGDRGEEDGEDDGDGGGEDGDDDGGEDDSDGGGEDGDDDGGEDDSDEGGEDGDDDGGEDDGDEDGEDAGDEGGEDGPEAHVAWLINPRARGKLVCTACAYRGKDKSHKTFAKVSEMATHYRLVHKQCTKSCTVCGNRFLKKNQLTEHKSLFH